MFKGLYNKQRSGAGFTLIEILVVIGIIAVLAAIVLIAINPARQFAQARDSQRDSNVNAILNAIGQYIADNKGENPPGIPAGVTPLAETEIDNSLHAEFCDALVPDYLLAIPVDPSFSVLPTNNEDAIDDCSVASWDSGYKISKAATGRITIVAPKTESRDDVIEITR